MKFGIDDLWYLGDIVLKFGEFVICKVEIILYLVPKQD